MKTFTLTGKELQAIHTAIFRPNEGMNLKDFLKINRLEEPLKLTREVDPKGKYEIKLEEDLFKFLYAEWKKASDQPIWTRALDVMRLVLSVDKLLETVNEQKEEPVPVPEDKA